MRVLALVAPLLLLGGCLGDGGDDASALEAIAACRAQPPVEHTLFFAEGLRLVPTLPAAGSAPGNAFSSGFLTNDLKEWLSDPVTDGLWLVGPVTLDYWVRAVGTPAPLAVDPNQPGDGYHFFNQFGSDRSLQPAYATEFAPIAPTPGEVTHYTEVLANAGQESLAPGGFVVERGDRVRVLLTDLTLDGPDGSGHDILFGGDTPSQVRFLARCFPDLRWTGSVVEDAAISLPGNGALLTGAIPPTEGLNLQTVSVLLPADTQRMTVRLTQGTDANAGAKDDIDLVLVERGGNRTYSVGSPYSDEAGTLWLDNLAEHFPAGAIDIQVHSYSGFAYEGRLVVSAERAALR